MKKEINIIKIDLLAVILLIIYLMFTSSCQSYRAERKIKKLKSWGYLSDSVVTKYDTINGFTHDSVYIFDTTTLSDTITTIKNGVKVVTTIKWKTREVRQIINQKDTILIRKFSTKVIKDKGKWWDTWFIGFICGVLTFIILIIILRYVLVTLGKNTDINTH